MRQSWSIVKPFQYDSIITAARKIGSTTGTTQHLVQRDNRSMTKAGLFFRTAVYHAFTMIVSKWVKLRVHVRQHSSSSRDYTGK
jgi:hypothetical protein